MLHGYKVVLYYLWIAPHALLFAVAALMYVRRLYRTFPVFFAYTLYEVFVFIPLFSIYLLAGPSSPLYRHIFIITLTLSTALRFGIIQEIFNNIFRDYPRLEKFATASRRWITGILVLAAIFTAFCSFGNAPENLLGGVRLLERSVTIIQIGLLLFLFVFSRVFGVSWRSYAFGIAFGFSIFASAQLAEWTLSLLPLTEPAKELLDLLATGSYHVAVLIWLGYLLTAEKSVRSPVCPIPEMDRWSGELERTR